MKPLKRSLISRASCIFACARLSFLARAVTSSFRSRYVILSLTTETSIRRKGRAQSDVVESVQKKHSRRPGTGRTYSSHAIFHPSFSHHLNTISICLSLGRLGRGFSPFGRHATSEFLARGRKRGSGPSLDRIAQPHAHWPGCKWHLLDGRWVQQQRAIEKSFP